MINPRGVVTDSQAVASILHCQANQIRPNLLVEFIYNDFSSMIKEFPLNTDKVPGKINKSSLSYRVHKKDKISTKC